MTSRNTLRISVSNPYYALLSMLAASVMPPPLVHLLPSIKVVFLKGERERWSGLIDFSFNCESLVILDYKFYATADVVSALRETGVCALHTEKLSTEKLQL